VDAWQGVPATDGGALTRAIAMLARRAHGEVRAAAIASVVPARTAAVARAVRAACGVSPKRFPAEIDGDLVVRPRPATSVGADRLANALGALALEERDAVVVDVGTAATVDVVTAAGVFEGGMIAPGPRIGARALARFTAQLPEVPFEEPTARIGRSTRQAIAVGLWHGFRGLVRALVEEALRERPGARVVVAGGDGERCLRGSGIAYVHVPALTHLGLDRALERAGEPS